MRTTPLGKRLILLTAAAILPLALASGLGLIALLHQQEEQTEQAALNLTRAMATAVDNELRSTISALQTLALTPEFASRTAPNDAAAHELASKVLASRPEWLAVLLLTPDGSIVLNTNVPLGQSAGRPVEPASLVEVVRSNSPVVGAIARGSSGNYGVPVRVPVAQDGQLRYVLTAVIRPDAILALVKRQQVPGDWVVSVFDSNHLRVARSRDHERFLGARPGPTLLAMLDALGDQEQSFGATETLEGPSVHTALARIKVARWTVALGVPTSVTANAARNSAVAYGGGLLLSVLLGGIAAWPVFRGIALPMARLRRMADAMDSRKPIGDVLRSGVTEIDAASDALVASLASRERAEVEREGLLQNELAARAAAEHAQRRLQLLANASSVLSTTLEEQSTLKAIGELIVPAIADICRIDLLDKQGVLQRKLTYHSDPERARLIDDFVRSGTASASIMSPMTATG